MLVCLKVAGVAGPIDTTESIATKPGWSGTGRSGGR